MPDAEDGGHRAGRRGGLGLGQGGHANASVKPRHDTVRTLKRLRGRSAYSVAGGQAQERIVMPASPLPPIFTIGHSTKSIAEFVALLRVGGVDLVIDIRSVPRSRTNPHYNLDRLPDELAPWQIAHTQLAELGGLRPKSKSVPPEVNGFWINQSFHNYADYALSQGFRDGLARLMALGTQRRCAIMCSEAVWWRCHRRIVADYLLWKGRAVVHLMGADRAEPARMNEAARARGDGLIYEAP
jgi:hypothetical protein